MIKVALYLENKNIVNIDLSKPYEGNPGIGGTEFMFVSMPYYYKEIISDDVEFIYYASNINSLHKKFDAVQVDSCYDAFIKSTMDQCDIFIWRPVDNEDHWKIIDNMDNFTMPVVAWVHNTLPQKMLDALADRKNLKRYITVSQEQLDILRQHQIINKTSVIFNGFDINTVLAKPFIEKDINMVVYTGSLIPAKGFGLLARAWKQILKEHPFAQLYVIGSGKLYNRNKAMGLWGVADEDFESSEIRPFLSDENGDICPSVHFLGVLGKEKNEYLSKAIVGVVNPSALTENCPGSALEFQASKTPVVSRADWGLLDTVVNKKTGLLGETDQDLIDNILYFLNNPEVSYSYGEAGRKFVNEKFTFSNIVHDWKNLFTQILTEKPNKVLPIKQNMLFRRKWLRELIRLSKMELNKEKIDKPFDKKEDLKKLLTIKQYLNNVTQALSPTSEQEFYIAQIKETNKKLQKKEQELLTIMSSLKRLNRYSFIKNPIKKLNTYKQLMKLYNALESNHEK